MGKNVSSVAHPGRSEFLFVPSLIPPRVEDAVNALSQMSESRARNLFGHVTDYRALLDMKTGLAAWPTKSEAEKEKIKFLFELVQKQLALIRFRKKHLFESGGMATRRKGEDRQRVIEYGFLESHPSGMEDQRLLSSYRLWDDSAVYVDVDTVPADPHPQDEAEKFLTMSMAAKRTSEGFSHKVFKLESLLQFSEELLSLAEEVAKTGHFARSSPDSEEAVSFIRELRIFGHGSAGSDDVQATFHLCGVRSADKVDDSWLLGLEPDNPDDAYSATAEEVLHPLRDYLCPGASILFEGCELAKGDKGKKLMALVGHHCFGDFKWGYIKGNQKETFKPVGLPEEGLPPVEPVTYKWPDDLQALANFLLKG